MEIIEVPENAYDASEQLGTKFKFWFLNEKAGRLCLFKQGRENTGEDWAEVVSCGIASLLGLPCAKYSFAKWRERLGVVSESFVLSGERLIVGNEIISPNVKRVSYGTNHHLVRKVTTLLKIPEINVPKDFISPEAFNANDVFVGYVLLDALLGNTDRHDENWGIVMSERGYELAPTYDHASGLGRELSDKVRERRLLTRDPNFTVEAYAQKARSALYEISSDVKPLTTLDAFLKVAETSARGRSFWVGKLNAVDTQSVNNILTQIPDDLMSYTAKMFATQVILFNKKRIQEAISS